MTLAQDFEDFVKLLNKHQVDYMVVGAFLFTEIGAVVITDYIHRACHIFRI